MAEYIEREALVQHMQECKDENAFTLMATGYAYSFIEAAPACDVVEVVRCKDCKHFCQDLNDESCGICNAETSCCVNVDMNDYCSSGEGGQNERGF